MATTRLGLYGGPVPAISTAQAEALAGKNIYSPGLRAQLVEEFDTWRPLYGGTRVYVYKAGTSNLASLYTDIDLSIAADNPQTLLSQTVGEIAFGKFDAPIYTPHAYYTTIEGEETGIQRPPLTKLEGEDGDLLEVRADGANVSRPLEDHMTQVVWLEDYGVIGESPTANNTALQAAIGAAGARNGVEVMLPAGIVTIVSTSLPAGVILSGRGKGATILRSTTGGAVLTAQGDGCGLRNLTLDGVNVVTNSIGFDSTGFNDIVMENVDIRRFATGLRMRGALRAHFRDLDFYGCTIGASLRGDDASTLGGPIRDLRWVGGSIEACITNGVLIEHIDEAVTNVTLAHLYVVSNLGQAVKAIGTQFLSISDCHFKDDPVGLRIEDADDDGLTDFTISLRVTNCRFDEADIGLDGVVLDVVFDTCALIGAEVEIETTTENNILFTDCTEDGAVEIAGDPTRLMRWSRTDEGAVRGTVTSASAFKAIGYELKPGESAAFTYTVVANQVDGEGWALIKRVHGGRRDTADINFDNGTIAFALGDIVTGLTSGASAYVTAITGTTSAGSLSLRAISGVFEDNEELQVDGTTNARANGTVSENGAAVAATAAAELYAHRINATALDCTLVAVGNEIQAQVVGIASRTYEVVVDVKKLVG